MVRAGFERDIELGSASAVTGDGEGHDFGMILTRRLCVASGDNFTIDDYDRTNGWVG